MRIETRDDAMMLREVLAPIWSEYYASMPPLDILAVKTPSTDMCCKTSAMIHAIDPQWRVVHGTVDGHAHSWCERDDGTALDLTGDQFDEAEVIWGELPERWIEDDHPEDHDRDCPGCNAA